MNKLLVGLLPTWNEEWILDFTLKNNSKIFDYIIILDQNSIDNTIFIANKYSNIIIKKNPNNSFNEDERQILLIEYARNLFPHSILFALDADEILFFHDFSKFKEGLFKLNPGTNILMPWIDVFPRFNKFLITRSKQFGYVDDGLEHVPDNLHSPRLPVGRINVTFENCVVIHLQYINLNRNRSKHLWYMHYEMANLDFGNRVTLLSKYLHFVFRSKKKYELLDKFFENFKDDLVNLELSQDKIWQSRLNSDFSTQDKIIIDVYDYFVFNKSVNVKSLVYSLLVFWFFHYSRLFSFSKKILNVNRFS